MSLWDKLKGELIDIIEWLDDTSDTLVYRFERYDNEIKNGAKLVVRESQMAVLIDQGKLADVYGPGTYTLTTENMPILTTLRGWKYGFSSPFKVEVYFVSTRQFTNLKWGTPGPCTMRDREFGVVRVTAYGLYSIRISDPAAVIKEIAGTDGRFTTDSIAENLRGKIGSRIKEVMPELGIPVIDLESKVTLMGNMLRERIAPDFKNYGLDLTEVQVQDIGLPEEVEQAIDKSGAIRVIGNLGAYTQYETANAIGTAAANPGGIAGVGAGLGVGMGMANQMMNSFGQPAAGQGIGAPVMPPPLPGAVPFFAAINGQQAGPFDPNTLQQYVAAGQITRDTLVWRQGMAGWTAAGQVAELQALFAGMPPPLPA